MSMQPHAESVRRGRSNGHAKSKSKRVKPEADTARLVPEFVERIRAVQSNQRKSRGEVVRGIIEEGDVLIEAKQKLGHGNGWMAMRDQLAKEFRYYADKVEDLLKISGNKVLRNSGNYLNLPTSITCLRVLADIKDLDRVQQLIDMGEINPDITIEKAREFDKHPALKAIEHVARVMEKYRESPSPKDWKATDVASLPKVIAWLQGIEDKRQQIVNERQAKADAAR